MKKLIVVLAMASLGCMMILHACKKDEGVPVTGMYLLSLTSDKADLIHRFTGEKAGGLSTTFNIVATFSSPIDYRSIRDTTIILHRLDTTIQLNFVVSGNTITIDPAITLLSGADLRLEFTNRIRSTNGLFFDGLTVYLETEGIGIDTPPQASEQLLYLPFDGSVTDVSLHATTQSSRIGYTLDRHGIASRAANFTGSPSKAGNTGVIAELAGDSLISGSMSFSTWINITQLAVRFSGYSAMPIFGLAGEKGYYAELSADTTKGPIALTWGTNHRLATGGFYKSIDTYTGTTVADSVRTLLSDGWHHLALTYDSSTTLKTIYIDGVQRAQWSVIAQAALPVEGIALNVADTVELAMGYYADKLFKSDFYEYATNANTFIGQLDDFRIFKVALKPEEITALFEMEKVTLGN